MSCLSTSSSTKLCRLIGTFTPAFLTLSAGSSLLAAIPEPVSLTPFVEMEAYEVTGTRLEPSDTTALKLSTRLIDTPRSVTVIDSSRIREQDFQSGSDLLLWVPGINTNGAASASYHFYARGYRMTANEWRVDGFQGRVVGGSYSPNLFGIEQVCVLKGPSGLLYGSAGSPGGMVNLITKKPSEESRTVVDARIRSFAGEGSDFGERVSTELDFDSTGKITKDGRFLYRLLASREDTAQPAVGQTDHNQFYRLSVSYKLDAAGRFVLTPSIEWTREERAARNATLSPSSSNSTADGRTDYTLADASPITLNLGGGRRVDENVTFGTDFNAKLSETWSLNGSLRSHNRDYVNNAYTIQTATLKQSVATDPRSWVVSRRHERGQSEVETVSTDVNTSYQVTVNDWLNNLTQLGVNARWVDSQAYTGTTGANQSPINIYSGFAAQALVADAGVPALGTLTRTRTYNAYLQNQTEFWKRVILTLGAAQAREKSETVTAAGVNAVAPTRKGDLSPNAALVYKINQQFSAYTSFSTSYSLPDPLYENKAGKTGTFDPTEGDSYEAGLKGEFFSRKLSAQIAVFSAELNGVLTQSDATDLNSNGNRYYTQLDTGRISDGVEVEISYRPLPAWESTLTYANIDARNRNLDGSDGAPAEMTPKHAVSFYSRYGFTQGALKGLALRLGFLWQSERVGGNSAPSATAPDPLLLRGFHRFDAGVSYRWRSWTAALNVENLSGERYVLAGNTGTSLSPGNPRSFALRLSHQW